MAWESLTFVRSMFKAFAMPIIGNEQRQISCNNQNDKKLRVNANIYSI